MDDFMRLSTEEAILGGVLNWEVPDIGCPQDRGFVELDYDVNMTGEVMRHLEEGKVVQCPEYYGNPTVWKVEEGKYRGALLQYRVVTQQEEFENMFETAEWFVDTAGAVAG